MTIAEKLVAQLSEKGLVLATAESCTGGLLGFMITTIPGASKIYDRGFITYSNAAKRELLKVPEELINKHGAVSKEVAEAMSRGACLTGNNISVAITGVAGPASSERKPVGLVYIAVCYQGKIRVTENHLAGTRSEIQSEAATKAIELILSVI